MKISVVTPNYNYASFIGETIESVLMQNYADFEYIIVDDGSTDNSVDVINSFVKKYPDKIHLITQMNRGQTPAINVGMKKITGDIVCWINSDDTFCPGIFSEIAAYFEQDKNCDIVFGDMNVVDMQGNFMYRRRHLNFSYLSGCLLGFTTILSSNAVFWKRDTMIKNGYFNESLKCNMDGDFYSRLTRGTNVIRLNKPFANFRKQNHTKASEKNSDWDNIVKQEIDLERRSTYKSLAISKIIPFKYSFIIKIPLQIIRVVQRTLSLHYYNEKLEQKNYNKSLKGVS